MKKILFLLAIVLTLASCSQDPTYTEATDKTELPIKVVKALDDTTQADVLLLHGEDDIFVIESDRDGKKYVSAKIDKEVPLSGFLLLGFILGIIVGGGIVASFASRY